MTPLLFGVFLVQAAPGQSRAVFPSHTELVKVVVSVTDKAGQPVAGLVKANFVVKEDGKARPIESFMRAADIEEEGKPDTPVDLVMLIDTSTSMEADLLRARDAAMAFINNVPSIRGRDIVSFDAKVWPWRYYAPDPAAVLDDILLVAEGGGTRLYDSIIEGLNRSAADSPRRTLVMLSDGEDDGSKWRREDVLTLLQASGVRFYAMSFAYHLPGLGPHNGLEPAERGAHGGLALQTLAESTGGFVVNGASNNLASEFQRIRNDIAAQYVIGFAPAASAAGKRHRLDINVAIKGLKIRYRTRYETPNEDGTIVDRRSRAGGAKSPKRPS